MQDDSLTNEAIARLEGIHKMSALYNAGDNGCHNEKLLQLLKYHVVEIEGLFREKDPHYLTETGDLAVLCFELLLEGGVSVNEVMARCFMRYEKKLGSLLRQRDEDRLRAD